MRATGERAPDADEKRELESLIVAKAADRAVERGTNPIIEESRLWDELYKRRRTPEEDGGDEEEDDSTDDDGDDGTTMLSGKRRKRIAKADCATCGVKNDSDANFCKGCGRAL